MGKGERPYILWYCTDQQRYDTIHAPGNPHIHTPNLVTLCEHGVAFADAYTQSPICTPSRPTFLTGRYSNAHHVHRNNNEGFPPGEKLVTKLLADAGYDCALAGKLHLSKASKGNLERRPDDGYRKFFWSNHPNPDYPFGHDYATSNLRSELTPHHFKAYMATSDAGVRHSKETWSGRGTRLFSNPMSVS